MILSSAPHFEARETIIICHKPVGLPSTPSETSKIKSAVDYALEQFPELAQIKGSQTTDFGLLHRLDNGTSGLLLFARNQTEFDHLKKQWASRAVRKFYQAIVRGHPPVQKITYPIGHSAKSSKRMIVIQNPPSKFLDRIRGKPQEAITEILSSKAISKNHSLVEIEIKTGVRHQIRAHLEAIGHPILGDVLYHGDQGTRLWLHAARLEITLQNGEHLVLTSEMHNPEISELD